MNALTQTSNTKSNWVLPGESDYVTSIGAPGLISANYTWEKAETFDVGFDLGLFDNRLETVFNWYQRDTKEMLAPSKALPGILGTSAPKSNAASLRTKGWEISLSWRSNIGKDFRYNLGFNLYDSKAEITKYDNPAGALDSDNTINLREGMQYGEIWGYTTDRFYTTADFLRFTAAVLIKAVGSHIVKYAAEFSNAFSVYCTAAGLLGYRKILR